MDILEKMRGMLITLNAAKLAGSISMSPIDLFLWRLSNKVKELEDSGTQIFIRQILRAIFLKGNKYSDDVLTYVYQAGKERRENRQSDRRLGWTPVNTMKRSYDQVAEGSENTGETSRGGFDPSLFSKITCLN